MIGSWHHSMLRLMVAAGFLTFFLRAVEAQSVASTVLVVAPDAAGANSVTQGLKAYGIPYRIAITTSTLPALNSTATEGNFGAIITINEPLTGTALNPVYAYQTAFGVRLVRLNATPGADSGTTAATGGDGCCNTNVEQLVSITNSTSFPNAGLKLGATVSSLDLFHYPASINNASIAWQVAQFGAGGPFRTASTAAVVNKIGAREQMVWFMPFSPEWSPTSAFLQHSYIHYATRGLFAGYRRLQFMTQVDDVFLITELFKPATGHFRVRVADLENHVTWMSTINSKMPAGSNYFIELGHNGNGNIELNDEFEDDETHLNVCAPGPIEYADQPDQTAETVEWKKPLGTGKDIWPRTPTSYVWTQQCAAYDPLEVWLAKPANLNKFAHVSHTFTHSDLTNATYADTVKEIAFNRAWLKQTGIDQATRYSGAGLIPPAITGLRNGDAIKAWLDNGINGVVGDNTRPGLLNTQNEYWPLVSNVNDNGFNGLTIMPRWATEIFYNCDTQACDLALWQAVSAPGGTWAQLVKQMQVTSTRNLLALRQDGFMFHQANMRQTDVSSTTVNGVSAKRSLLQFWVELIVGEMTRLTTWPFITRKHDDLVKDFLGRMARDQCNPTLTYNYSGRSIVSVTVSALNTNCGAPIPVTFPGTVKSTGSAVREQVGTEPLALWVTLGGASQTFELSTPIPV